MTTDELRAKFESTISNFNTQEFHACFSLELNDDGKYKDEAVLALWNGYRLGRASRDAEVEMLRKDAERLTWFETQREAYGFEDVHEGNRWTIEGPFNTLRKAIDAVMQEERK